MSAEENGFYCLQGEPGGSNLLRKAVFYLKDFDIDFGTDFGTDFGMNF